MADERRGDAATRPDVLTFLSLFDAVATGGYALVIVDEDAGGAATERLLAAAPPGFATGRLSCHAGGRGDLAPWICLAFDLAPFDPAPAPSRLSAFFEAEADMGRRPLLIAEGADRLEKSELAALRRVTGDGEICSVILIGEEAAAERLRAAAPAPLAAVLRTEAPALAPEKPAIRPATDAFAIVARAAAHPPAIQPQPDQPPPAAAKSPPQTERVSDSAAPARPQRRVRPYGAAGAAAAAAFAAFVIGALTLVDPERRAEAPPPAETAAMAPAAPAPEPETQVAESPEPALEETAPPLVAAREPEGDAAAAPSGGAAPGPDLAALAAAAPQPAPPEPAPEPTLRITIHHAVADRDRAGDLLTALRRAGFGDVALWPLDAAPEASGVRYFDEADAEAAALLDEAVQEALGPSRPLAPVSRPQTEAPRGTLEIWLAG